MSSIITLERKIYLDQSQSRHVVYTEIGLDKLYNFSVNNSSGMSFTYDFYIDLVWVIIFSELLIHLKDALPQYLSVKSLESRFKPLPKNSIETFKIQESF